MTALMSRYYGLIPAAGSGSRFGAAQPKQYLAIGGRTLLDLSIESLASHPRIHRVFVVLAPDDGRYVPSGAAVEKIVVCRCGGATRADSVLNGLRHAALDADDRVLVHDAARPCLSTAAVDRLISTVGDDPAGGILAIPVADTLKRAGEQDRISETQPRDRLWQAQTPQLFPYGVLLDALTSGDRTTITDEASAVEQHGIRPKLVWVNLRISR